MYSIERRKNTYPIVRKIVIESFATSDFIGRTERVIINATLKSVVVTITEVPNGVPLYISRKNIDNAANKNA